MDTSNYNPHNIYLLFYRQCLIPNYQICTSYLCHCDSLGLICCGLSHLLVRLNEIVNTNNNQLTQYQFENNVTLLTTSPINWTAIDLSIINWNASGNQTVCIMNFDITFDLLTIGIINNGCVVKIFITNACITARYIRKHFLTLNVFFVLQIASCF